MLAPTARTVKNSRQQAVKIKNRKAAEFD